MEKSCCQLLPIESQLPKFNDDGICFVELKNGSDILYLTVDYKAGYATSPDGFIQPEEFH